MSQILYLHSNLCQSFSFSTIQNSTCCLGDDLPLILPFKSLCFFYENNCLKSSTMTVNFHIALHYIAKNKNKCCSFELINHLLIKESWRN